MKKIKDSPHNPQDRRGALERAERARWRDRRTVSCVGAPASSTSGLTLLPLPVCPKVLRSGSAETATSGTSVPSPTRAVRCTSTYAISTRWSSGTPRSTSFDSPSPWPQPREAHRRTWKSLAKERIENTRPQIPLGRRFWSLTAEEAALAAVFSEPSITRLATMVNARDDDARVELVDAAYWMKGCSSLGLLRYGVLLDVSDDDTGVPNYGVMDVKEAVAAIAPRSKGAEIPDDHARRVVEGARHISPFLGERMRASSVLGTSVFIREILPQDLKIELNQMATDEALMAAEYLATVVGFAHARQLDSAARLSWQAELSGHRSKELNAPSWLWTNVVGLLVDYERTYLEFCRRYALAQNEHPRLTW